MLWQITSLTQKIFLRLRGVKIGKNVHFRGPVRLLLRDGARARQLRIGDNVLFDGTVHIRIRKEGQIIIKNNVSVGHEVWLVGANQATLKLCAHSMIGNYCILNGGHGIEIGSYSWLAGFVYFNSSDHRFAPGKRIMDQGYFGAPIIIGDDNWIGGQTFLTKGVRTGTGVVIGAGAIVTKDIPDNAIAVGNPAKVIRFRDQPKKTSDENV